jgi:hypothetical protein
MTIGTGSNHRNIPGRPISFSFPKGHTLVHTKVHSCDTREGQFHPQCPSYSVPSHYVHTYILSDIYPAALDNSPLHDI